MNNKTLFPRLGALMIAAALLAAAPAPAQSTYQGELKSAGSAFTGLADLEFRLYDSLAAGTQVGSTLTRPDRPVEDGLFQVELDFGAGAFDGQARFLEISVDGTPLSPRQRVAAAPVALFALDENVGSPGAEGASPFELDSDGWSFSYVALNNKFEFRNSSGSSNAPSTIFADVRNEADEATTVSGDDSRVYPNVALGGAPGFATVSGGEGNRAEGHASAVGGGRENKASGDDATIGGGENNVASGPYATLSELHVKGPSPDAGFNSAGSRAVFSDERLKENIKPLSGALDRLLALEGVTFRYREGADVLGATGLRMGFVAQQVEAVFPEWIGENAAGTKYVSPSGFEALTVEALRELSNRQKATIAGLREQVQDQQRRVARLEIQLLALAGLVDVTQPVAIATDGGEQ